MTYNFFYWHLTLRLIFRFFVGKFSSKIFDAFSLNWTRWGWPSVSSWSIFAFFLHNTNQLRALMLDCFGAEARVNRDMVKNKLPVGKYSLDQGIDSGHWWGRPSSVAWLGFISSSILSDMFSSLIDVVYGVFVCSLLEIHFWFLWLLSHCLLVKIHWLCWEKLHVPVFYWKIIWHIWSPCSQEDHTCRLAFSCIHHLSGENVEWFFIFVVIYVPSFTFIWCFCCHQCFC